MRSTSMAACSSEGNATLHLLSEFGHADCKSRCLPSRHELFHVRLTLGSLFWTSCAGCLWLPNDLRDGTGESFVETNDASKTVFEHQLASRFDLRRASLLSMPINHRESERRVNDIVHFITGVRSMLPRSFAALFRTNTGNDQASNTMFNEPDVKTAADQRTMAGFVENRIGVKKSSARCDMTRCKRTLWQTSCNFRLKRLSARNTGLL